jgi:hypothetical protein
LRHSPTDLELMQFLRKPQSLSAAGFAAAQAHGLSPWFSEPTFFAALSALQQQQVKKHYAREYLQDQQHALHLQTLQQRLTHANLRALVIKGAALTRQIYPALGLRCKSDLDLWVPLVSLPAMRSLLFELGYRDIPANFGNLTQPEQSFVKQDAERSVRIDLHWEVSSRPLLARAFPFAAIWAQAQEFGFGSHCLAPNGIDALLIAVIHRVGHHRDGERWIWLKDIDLLWRRMSDADQAACIARATERGVRALVHEALQSTAAIFNTPISETSTAALSARTPAELSARLLEPKTSLLAFDFQSLALRDFLRLLGEHLFPPAAYMQHRFGRHAGWRRPWNHVKRWISSRRS